MTLRPARAVVAALVASASGIAHAQIAPPAFWDPQRDDVITTELAGTLTQQSNPFAVSNGSSDTIFQGLVGLRFARDFSLQRLSLDASATPTVFFDNSEYNYVGLRGGLQWDWEIGRPIFGQVVVRGTRDRTAFENLNLIGDNIYTQWGMRGLAGFRLTPSWAVFGAVDYDTLTNSLISQQAADRDRTGFEAGFRYQPGAATEFDFLYRVEDGKYPNQQVLGSNGQPLPNRVDNGYGENSLLARLWYRPSDASRFGGVVGYSRRSYDNFGERDFSGPVLGFNADWAQTGQLSWRVELLRSIESDQYSLSANYVDVKRIAVRPRWQATGKVSIDFLAAYMLRDHAGDPGLAVGTPQREDKVTQLGATTNIELARNLFGQLILSYTKRSSNYELYSYDNTVFGAGIRALF